MKFAANILGAIALIVGVIWMLQGLNYLGGSFMSGARQWFWIGLLLTVASLIWLWWRNFARP